MKRTTGAMAVLAAAALTLSACGGGGDESTSAAGGAEGQAPDQSERCTEDLAGGTITVGEFSMLPSFAPGQGQYGVRGGAQSAAVYDRLMVWNPEAEEFEPKLAESLEANDDNTVWTLKLRDGVTFSNGDPLTAEDVVFTVGLHKDPATRSVAMTEAMQISDVRAVDPLTVEFTLADPWAGFPITLAGTVGEVIPQAAYEAADPQEWSRNPIGAGAFTVANYVPDQETVLEPNPDYYGGPVCPTLKFIRIPGSQGTYDAFQTGEVQVGFLRGAKFVNMAQNDDVRGFEEIISSGSVINMNSGKAGYDGILTDVRARQAVAAALDRDLWNQRLYDGEGQPTSALIADSSRLYDGQEGPVFDAEKAKSLVAELKADRPDWNGELRMLISDGPENIEAGVVAKALLDAAGFNVVIDNAPVSQVTARQFTGDYEIVIGGLATSDADPAAAFASGMLPGGATNLTGIDDPELTAAVNELKAAGDLDAQKAALTRLQEVFNEVQPFTVMANAEQYVAVADTVGGLTPTLSSTVLYDGAFVKE
ncbi:peptide ABC transporter substrate-binding protein [Dietzia sp. HMSC21D01]|uniref:ABC transporter substrate-binding protein n=1 Tax=Dietzia cinnamea TaxID=321318 RepID=A0AAW5QAN2_9ACTN|nr:MULTISPECIES: ABC transporter substrate-binding protein [Dietzia]MCT1864551.1 ABC transporter substrate-binding protein [Dietzia cinnamea]MCT2030598.1 ABC transporter substrate-binding protein [Dietzia cinnamea]MCT2033367.1 ABC transporter substrate-binding protein [Dietzia cinnamea]MCT2076946.1 ABC transporter substrate-binding protein [Dietzia cinnamea]MCT2106275.1 ABC transporter substrate-binding protein [Dietzia cinnamea]